MINKDEFTNSMSMLGLTAANQAENSVKEDNKKPTKYAKVGQT